MMMMLLNSFGGCSNQVFLISKTGSSRVPPVEFPNFSDFGEIDRVVGYHYLLFPVPKLWHG